MSNPQEESDPTIRRIQLGVDFENLMKHPTMVAVCALLDTQRAELLELFTDISSMDSEKIADVQKRIWCIDNWQRVVGEFIVDGEAARQQLLQREQQSHHDE